MEGGRKRASNNTQTSKMPLEVSTNTDKHNTYIPSLIRRLFRNIAGVLKGVEGRIAGAIEKGSGRRNGKEGGK